MFNSVLYIYHKYLQRFVISKWRKCENMNDKRSANDNICEKLTFWLENVFGVVDRCLLYIRMILI